MASLLPTIIYSDLDGTLLDHYTYDFSPAISTIEQVKAINIPIVLTTSKTLVEVTALQHALCIDSPMIIENGAAVYIPKTTFDQQPDDTVSVDDYWVKSFVPPIEHWLDIIKQAPKEFDNLHRGFSSLSVDELVEITNLTTDDATSAKCRHYGEPIHWLGDQASKQAFIKYLKDAGANILQGGRFFHVSGDCDKGKALSWLTQQYQTLLFNQEVTTIALGDGENDTAMLEAADVAVQICSPVHAFPTLSTQQTSIVKTQDYGPKGWAQAIQQLLEKQLSSGSQYSQIIYSTNSTTHSTISEATHG